MVGAWNALLGLMVKVGTMEEFLRLTKVLEKLSVSGSTYGAKLRLHRCMVTQGMDHIQAE